MSPRDSDILIINARGEYICIGEFSRHYLEALRKFHILMNKNKLDFQISSLRFGG